MIAGVINKEGLREPVVGVSLDASDEVLTCNAAVDFLISTLSSELQPRVEETFQPLRDAKIGVVEILAELEGDGELRALIEEEGGDIDDVENFFIVGLPENATTLVKLALEKYAQSEDTNQLSAQHSLDLIKEIDEKLVVSGKITPASLN